MAAPPPLPQSPLPSNSHLWSISSPIPSPAKIMKSNSLSLFWDLNSPDSMAVIGNYLKRCWGLEKMRTLITRLLIWRFQNWNFAVFFFFFFIDLEMQIRALYRNVEEGRRRECSNFCNGGLIRFGGMGVWRVWCPLNYSLHAFFFFGGGGGDDAMRHGGVSKVVRDW